MEVVRKLDKVLLSEYVPTAVDLHESLQLQDLFGRPLFQGQQQVASVSGTQLRQAMLIFPNDY